MADDDTKKDPVTGDPPKDAERDAAEGETEAAEGEGTAEPGPVEAEAEGEGEGEGDALDAASPEAIAKRVAALGGDDEIEKIAQEEEQKLAERRARAKKKRGKKGLEAAASKRLARIGDK